MKIILSVIIAAAPMVSIARDKPPLGNGRQQFEYIAREKVINPAKNKARQIKETYQEKYKEKVERARIIGQGAKETGSAAYNLLRRRTPPVIIIKPRDDYFLHRKQDGNKNSSSDNDVKA